jgi:hypothetical protein
MLLGSTGFQPVCLYSHRLEAGATQESPEIIYSSQRLLLHPFKMADPKSGRGFAIGPIPLVRCPAIGIVSFFGPHIDRRLSRDRPTRGKARFP